MISIYYGKHPDGTKPSSIIYPCREKAFRNVTIACMPGHNDVSYSKSGHADVDMTPAAHDGLKAQAHREMTKAQDLIFNDGHQMHIAFNQDHITSETEAKNAIIAALTRAERGLRVTGKSEDIQLKLKTIFRDIPTSLRLYKEAVDEYLRVKSDSSIRSITIVSTNPRTQRNLESRTNVDAEEAKAEVDLDAKRAKFNDSLLSLFEGMHDYAQPKHRGCFCGFFRGKEKAPTGNQKSIQTVLSELSYDHDANTYDLSRLSEVIQIAERTCRAIEEKHPIKNPLRMMFKCATEESYFDAHPASETFFYLRNLIELAKDLKFLGVVDLTPRPSKTMSTI